MYVITIENGGVSSVLCEGQTKRTKRKLKSGQIVDSKNAISSFTFEIYSSHPEYENIHAYKTLVKIFNSDKNRLDFVGRVLEVTPRMSSDGVVLKEVVCEDRLAYLCDSVQPYVKERYYEGDSTRNGLQEFIDVLLDNHNAQVEAYKRVYRGNVTVTSSSTGGVTKGLNYESTWSCIQEKLLKSFGGEIRIREAEDGLLYLDYAEKLGATRATKIELARNMKAASQTIDPTSIVTRLIPLGTKLEEEIVEVDENGNETVKNEKTEQRLTIESVNNGIAYVEDQTAYQLYGAIYGTQVWDDVTEASNLKEKAQDYLINNNKITVSYDIEAYDLSLLGLDVDDFKVYDSYPTINKLIGLDTTLEIIKKTTDIYKPYSSSIGLGDNEMLLSDAVMDYSAVIKNVESQVQQVNNTVSNASSAVSSVTESITSIQQTTEGIAAAVSESTITKSDYETFAKQVRNILAMDADGTTMLFQTLYTTISEVQGEASSNYEEIMKYIRFENGTITLGERENPITLTVENDRVVIKENGVEVAYFSDQKLYVTDGEFTSSLMLGNFAFVPRSNGNISFKKVRG